MNKQRATRLARVALGGGLPVIGAVVFFGLTVSSTAAVGIGIVAACSGFAALGFLAVLRWAPNVRQAEYNEPR
ncbi:MAG: hypothetical protein ACRDLS_10185 [Solirubrobacteraceae bacterium]